MKKYIKGWLSFLNESYPFLIGIGASLCVIWYFSRPHETWPIVFLLGVMVMLVLFVKENSDKEDENKELKKLLDDNGIVYQKNEDGHRKITYIVAVIIGVLLSAIDFFKSPSIDDQQLENVEYKTSPYHKEQK